ncbi:MAG: preprotein translocase subunit SecE [Candidatus Omnitrophica bacterium]|nr:preprotein translocase subunit SecE [Candidatus Omnitrophota bacterium]MBU1038366.1 preprotein translocase subunit SecE [Candidatus Omnitrophota bacterium]
MAKIKSFFKDIRLELGKVSWPTKDELIGSTGIVLVSLALLALFIGICDAGLSALVNIIMSKL